MRSSFVLKSLGHPHIEKKLVLARNPLRMDYHKKYEEIVADYNRGKNRVTIEETFRG